jgi:hypothetical protein
MSDDNVVRFPAASRRPTCPGASSPGGVKRFTTTIPFSQQDFCEIARVLCPATPEIYDAIVRAGGGSPTTEDFLDYLWDLNPAVAPVLGGGETQ